MSFNLIMAGFVPWAGPVVLVAQSWGLSFWFMYISILVALLFINTVIIGMGLSMFVEKIIKVLTLLEISVPNNGIGHFVIIMNWYTKVVTPHKQFEGGIKYFALGFLSIFCMMLLTGEVPGRRLTHRSRFWCLKGN